MIIIDIHVILTDGTVDTVNPSQFVNLLRSHKIAAIKMVGDQAGSNCGF